MRKFSFAVLLALFAQLSAAQTPPSRPPITGIARISLYSTDLVKSGQFYGSYLGLEKGKNACTSATVPCYSINGRQELQLIQVTSAAPDNMLAEIAFATPDIAGMRRYLLAHKIDTGPVTKDSDGSPLIRLKDPEGNPIAFLQRSTPGFFTPAPHQISTKLIHAGFIVHNLEIENRFYRDLLGFRLYWYGGFKDDTVDWYEIQVPDGDNWLEYMLNVPATADRKDRGVQNHFSLAVADAQLAAERIRANGLASMDGPQIGRDGKRAFDIYDPDLTRVEVMDFTPSRKPCCHPYSAPHPKP